MTKQGLIAGLALLVSASGLAAKPSAEILLTRSEKWIVKYDDNSCQLMAQFGLGKAAIWMKLTRYQPGDYFDLMLYGEPFRADARDSKITLNFGLSPEPLKRDVMAGRAGTLPFLMPGGMRLDGRVGDNAGEPAPITVAQEAAVRGLSIEYRGKRYRLEAGSFDKPLAALRKCQTDLVKFWGYDPEVQAQLSRAASPLGNPGNWANTDDFPKHALDGGHSGLVKFRLDISDAGAVTGCSVLEQTSPIEFGKVTCQVLQRRGKFAPALDKDGKPTKSYWVSSVRWLA